MSSERNGKNRAPAGRLVPISDEERRTRLSLELTFLQAAWDIPADETETGEAWDEALRNLGVDPTTGRGLAPPADPRSRAR